MRPLFSVFVLAVALFLTAGTALPAADSPATETKPAPKEAVKKSQKKKLTGADLYAIHCNRCHPERYATERTAAQWKTIMLHMRVRAYLPTDQAKQILKYLQEDAGK